MNFKRFASAKMSGPNGRLLENNYTKGDCYPQNMEFTYAENPTAHTVQVRTEGEFHTGHRRPGPHPRPGRHRHHPQKGGIRPAGRGAPDSGRPPGDHLPPGGEKRHGYTTAVLGLGENQDSLNAKLVMERVARHMRAEGRELLPDLLRQHAIQPNGCTTRGKWRTSRSTAATWASTQHTTQTSGNRPKRRGTGRSPDGEPDEIGRYCRMMGTSRSVGGKVLLERPGLVGHCAPQQIKIEYP